jgi:hypothetical protein
MTTFGPIDYEDMSHLNAQWQQERPPMAGLGKAYGQHSYVDVSYLNARLRPILPADVGLSPDGMGGGSLGGNSLGADDSGFSKAQVQDAQDTINGALLQAGYQPMVVDGTLGPATCGGIAWYQQNVNPNGGASFAAACSSVAAKPPVKSGGSTPSSSRPSSGGAALPSSTSSGASMFGSGGGTNWLLWGGAIGAVAIGGALMFRASKKR